MRDSTVMNTGLLATIARAGEISYENLKNESLSPVVPGIVQVARLDFDNDLNDLELKGYITRDGNIIKKKK